MHRIRALILSVLLAFPAFCQTTPAERNDSAGDEPAAYGLTLSPAVFAKVLNKISEKMAQDLKCDEMQAAELKETFTKRIKEFVKQNQADINVLANQFIDAMLEDEAPTPEAVAKWAERAMPILEKAREMVSGMGDDMRSFLNEEQMVTIEAGLAAADVGFTFMNQKFGTWAAGGYNPAIEWHKSPGAEEIRQKDERAVRIAMINARQARLAAGPGGALPAEAKIVVAVPSPESGGATSKPAEPADEWTIYTEQFCAKYEFDDEQRSKAKAELANAHRRRDDYLAKNEILKRIEELEVLFRTADDQAAIDAAEAKYQALMEPVDRAFDKLKEDLDKLPYRAQRRKVQEAEQTTQPARETAARP